MKSSFEPAYRQEAFGISPIETIDHVLEQPYMRSSMFQESMQPPAIVKPVARCTREMPLPDHHHHDEDDHGKNYHDQNVQRKDPGLVQVENAKECYGPQN